MHGTHLNAFDVQIRLAQSNDMEWINQTYDSIKFIRSDLSNEMIGVAEVSGEKVGVGRMVKLEEKVYELGGMYVCEHYRKHKIASKIIEFLLNNVEQSCTIYCVPFKHLEHFYCTFGFQPCVSKENVPGKLAAKLSWCNQTYEHEVSCLVKHVS